MLSPSILHPQPDRGPSRCPFLHFLSDIISRPVDRREVRTFVQCRADNPPERMSAPTRRGHHRNTTACVGRFLIDLATPPSTLVRSVRDGRQVEMDELSHRPQDHGDVDLSEIGTNTVMPLGIAEKVSHQLHNSYRASLSCRMRQTRSLSRKRSSTRKARSSRSRLTVISPQKSCLTQGRRHGSGYRFFGTGS